MPKKKNRRSEDPRADLKASLNLKTRYELYDQDYLDKLTEEELDWLNKFNKEYNGASLSKEKPRSNLHRTKKLKKDCYDRNNARNRCQYTRAKASKQLTDFEDLIDESTHNDYEDHIIEEIDKKGAREAIEWLADQLEKDEQNLEERLISEEEVKSSKRK